MKKYTLTKEHKAQFPAWRDKLIDKTNDFIAYLKVSKEAEVKHLRSFDTHESLLLAPGNYVVRRQREYVPEGFRRVAD